MRYDYRGTIAIVAIWAAVGVTAIAAPDKLGEVVGYAVGGTFIVAFFL